MNHRKLRGGLVLAALLCVCACGDKVDRNAPLAFVPADTPWVFANLEPAPESIRARHEQQMQAAWPVMLGMFDSALADIEKISAAASDDAHDGDTEGGDTEGGDADAGAAGAAATIAKQAKAATAVRVLGGVLDELRTLDTPAKWQAVGLSPQAHAAFYGIGLLPVLRLELSDPEAFRALVARLEEKTGNKLATARIGEQALWTFGTDEVGGVMAIQGSHLVLGLMPGGADEALRRRVLGLDRPVKSLADSGALAHFNKARGYLPHGSGWVDTRRIVALVGTDEGVAAIARAAGSEPPALDATCRAELDAIAAKAPRLAFGYTALDGDRMSMHSRIDLEPALAQALLALGSSTPGGATRDALFDFGIALPVLGLRDFFLAQADAVAKAPYRCEQLKGLNEAFAEARPKLEGMLPPPVANLSGLRLTATRLAWPQGADKPDFAGTLVVGSSSPALLAGLAQLASPELQKVTLAADGKPVAIPASALPAGYADLPVSVAMGTDALALAIGKDEGARLGTTVAAAPSKPGTWLDASFSGSVYDLFGDVIDRFSMLMPDAERQQFEAQRKLYSMYAQWFRRLDLQVAVVPEGIDFSETVEFAAP